MAIQTDLRHIVDTLRIWAEIHKSMIIRGRDSESQCPLRPLFVGPRSPSPLSPAFQAALAGHQSSLPFGKATARSFRLICSRSEDYPAHIISFAGGAGPGDGGLDLNHQLAERNYRPALLGSSQGHSRLYPYRWWVSGTLPIGLVASPSPATTYDLVHGTPAQVGSSTFSVTVRGCGGHISSHRYTVSIAPAQTAHSVSLKWQPSPTAVSYDLYRSTFSGGPYGLVASAILGTSFVDQSVTAGETYFYVATAWDGTKESGFSNQVTAAVP